MEFLGTLPIEITCKDHHGKITVTWVVFVVSGTLGLWGIFRKQPATIWFRPFHPRSLEVTWPLKGHVFTVTIAELPRIKHLFMLKSHPGEVSQFFGSVVFRLVSQVWMFSKLVLLNWYIASLQRIALKLKHATESLDSDWSRWTSFQGISRDKTRC